MSSLQTVKYGTHIAEVSSAAGIRGVLCKDIDGRHFFRVYSADHSFTDYVLRHDDLTVTIAEDELASFYRIGEDHILDHSPSVLGLDVFPSDEGATAAQSS